MSIRENGERLLSRKPRVRLISRGVAKNSRGNVARSRPGLAIRSRANLWFRTVADDNGVEPANERAAA